VVEGLQGRFAGPGQCVGVVELWGWACHAESLSYVCMACSLHVPSSSNIPYRYNCQRNQLMAAPLIHRGSRSCWVGPGTVNHTVGYQAAGRLPLCLPCATYCFVSAIGLCKFHLLTESIQQWRHSLSQCMFRDLSCRGLKMLSAVISLTYLHQQSITKRCDP
jgi:hypothetical protein